MGVGGLRVHVTVVTNRAALVFGHGLAKVKVPRAVWDEDEGPIGKGIVLIVEVEGLLLEKGE